MEALEKIYLYPSDLAGEDSVEYTRTNDFIEKACK